MDSRTNTLRGTGKAAFVPLFALQAPHVNVLYIRLFMEQEIIEKIESDFGLDDKEQIVILLSSLTLEHVMAESELNCYEKESNS